MIPLTHSYSLFSLFSLYSLTHSHSLLLTLTHSLLALTPLTLTNPNPNPLTHSGFSTRPLPTVDCVQVYRVRLREG